MRAAVRGALWAGLRLLIVVVALILFAAWWLHEKAPDYRIDQRLRLLPARAAEPAPAANLGGDVRDGVALRCGQTLRYEFTVPGGHAALRFHDGHITGHPVLSVRVVTGGAPRELEQHETVEAAWTERRVPLPVSAGSACTLELAALDGRGVAGLGVVYLADVVLESDGRGVDETEVPIATRALEQDLLAQPPGERRFAPRTTESTRIGVEGPACVPLEENQPLWVTTAPLPPGARLELALHVGRPWPDAPAAQAEVAVVSGDRVLGTVPVSLAPPGATGPVPVAREVSASLDLSEFAGRALDLGLRRTSAPALWIGVREMSVTAARSVPRSRFVPGSGRNVLLVVVDSLRGDRLGCAGWPVAHTPVIDSLALRGGRWSHVLAPSSWNLPDVASLLTGVAPLSHGLGTTPGAQLSPRLPTLAQSAEWSGCATACFSNSVVTGPQHGLDRGYEHVEVDRLPAAVLADRAVDWLQDASQYEWFLTLDLSDPSFPNEPALRDARALPGPPPAALVDRLRKLDSRPGAAEALASDVGTRYDAALAGVDRAIGRITDWLAARDLLKNTLVAVVGSCGEEFYEHGGRLHGQTLWDEVVSVPLVMAGPGMRGPDGSAFVQAEPISLLDVTRLLGEYGRLSTREGLQGRLPPPFGPVLPDPVFHALVRPTPTVTTADLDASRTRRWLRILDHASGAEQLFDLAADPGATHDLLADRDLPEARRKELHAEADSLAGSFGDWVRETLLASWPAAEPVEMQRP